MKCKTWQRQICRLMDDLLAEQAQSRLYAHLAECETCRRFLAAQNKLQGLVRSDRIDFPADLDRRVLQVLHAGSRKVHISWLKSWLDRQRTLALPAPLAYGAALLLVMLFALAWQLGHQGGKGAAGLVSPPSAVPCYDLPTIEIHTAIGNESAERPLLRLSWPKGERNEHRQWPGSREQPPAIVQLPEIACPACPSNPASGGSVTIMAYVDSQGHFVSGMVENDARAQPALAAAALSAAQRLRFAPARQNGKAAACWVRLTFVYTGGQSELYEAVEKIFA